MSGHTYIALGIVAASVVGWGVATLRDQGHLTGFGKPFRPAPLPNQVGAQKDADDVQSNNADKAQVSAATISRCTL